MICKISKIDCLPEKKVVFGNVAIEKSIIPFRVFFDNAGNGAVYFSSLTPEMAHKDRADMKKQILNEAKKLLVD